MDFEILSLFPSLDFNRKGVHSQSRKGMKRNLKILWKTAENGFVTKYDLTDERSTMRMGGQSAQNGLEELTEMGLLYTDEIKSQKRTLRKDRKLTPKGILACLVFKEFHEVEELRLILNRYSGEKSELVSTLILYNNTFSRGRTIKSSTISPVVKLVKGFARQGFNLERKNNDQIVADMRKTDEKGFLEGLKTSPVDFVTSSMLSFSEDEDQSQFQKLITLMNENSSTLKELTKSLDESDREELVNIMRDFLNGLLLFFTSQEVSIWLKMGKKKFSIEELSELTKKELEKCSSEDDNPLEKVVNLFPVMQKILRENLLRT